jgi:hypothetical protein
MNGPKQRAPHKIIQPVWKKFCKGELKLAEDAEEGEGDAAE